MIDELVDIVSKNGNLLLSIGPKPDGMIGECEAAILRDFGDWSKLNGEAIYATSLAWPEDGAFRITILRSGNSHESRPIASVDFLSGKSPVEWKQTNEALVIETDGMKPCEAAYAFRIQFSEE